MRKMEITPRDWDKFVEDCQRHGTPVEILDCREEVLLDSFICEIGDLLIFVKDHFLNSWSSDYMLTIARTDGDRKKVWKMWDEYIEAYDMEYPQED